MNKAGLFLQAVLLLGLALNGSAAADEMQQIGAAELKQLITGNTVHNSCQVTGEISKTYFDPSGNYTRDQQGQISEGPYYIKDDGTHCNVVNGKHNCAGIWKVDGGKYHRILPSGKRVGIWEKIVPGRDI